MVSIATTLCCWPSALRVARAARCAAAVALAAAASTACATVAPQERAILSDPAMQFQAEPKHDSSLRHAIENREGSTGGTGVAGGGCGCN